MIHLRALFSLAAATFLAAQLPLPMPVRTFIGNGRLDSPMIVPGAGDVSSFSINPQGVAVDQAGNVIVGVGNFVRVTRGARLVSVQAPLVVGPTTVAVSPTGLAVGAGALLPCLGTATPTAANGFFFTRVLGNCFDARDAGDGGNVGNARFLKISGLGIGRDGDIFVYDGEAGKVRRVDTAGIIRTVASNVRLSGPSSSVSPIQLPAHPDGGVAAAIADGQILRFHAGGTQLYNIADFSEFSPFTWDLDDNFYYIRRSDGALVRQGRSGLPLVIGLRGRMDFREGVASTEMSMEVSGLAADTAGNVYVFQRVQGRNVANNPLDFRLLRIQIPGVGRPDCTFSVTSNPVPAAGGSVSIGVTASAAGCYWTADTPDTWLQVPTSQQRGNGALTITVSANTGGARNASIVIGGQTFTISQGAAAVLPPDASGTITTFAGTGLAPITIPLVTNPVPLSSFQFGAIGEMAFDSRGDLFVADFFRGQVLRIDTRTNTVSAVAGAGRAGSLPSMGGPATQVALPNVYGLEIDSNDNIYVMETTGNPRPLLRFRVGGNIERVAIVPGSTFYSSLAWDPMGQRILVNNGNIFEFRDGTLNQLTGVRVTDFNFTEGMQALNAFVSPHSVAIDGSGNILFSDASRRVRRISPSGTLHNVAGNGVSGSGGDNGLATAAQLTLPLGVIADRAGNIYVADNIANRVRRVRPDGLIETAVGTGAAANNGDGGRASAAAISSPSTLAFDSAGSLYIGTSSGVIRKVTFPRPTSAISSGGIVNLSGGVVSPGGLFSIYGTNLAPAPESAPSFPLPTTLGGVSVLVNGAAIPLTYVSPTQINAQLPFGIAPGRVTVTIRNASGVTEAATVEVGGAGPAILEYGSRRAVATSATAALNTDQAPAAAGDVIIVYLTGIGAVDPAVPSGTAAPLDALSRAVAPASATIGGRPAQLLFLGLAPGFAGLAQANLVVPELPAGTHPVEITVGGARSNTPAISVR